VVLAIGRCATSTAGGHPLDALSTSVRTWGTSSTRSDAAAGLLSSIAVVRRSTSCPSVTRMWPTWISRLTRCIGRWLWVRPMTVRRHAVMMTCSTREGPVRGYSGLSDPLLAVHLRDNTP
jgi:hypothetical protein